jgi:hypothetical protein
MVYSITQFLLRERKEIYVGWVFFGGGGEEVVGRSLLFATWRDPAFDETLISFAAGISLYLTF